MENKTGRPLNPLPSLRPNNDLERRAFYIPSGYIISSMIDPSALATHEGTPVGRYGVGRYGRCRYGNYPVGIYGTDKYGSCLYGGGYSTVSHAPSHEWGGYDKVDVGGLMAAVPKLFLYLPTAYSTFTSTLTGTATNTARLLWISMYTGTTINSTGVYINSSPFYFQIADDKYRMGFCARIGFGAAGEMDNIDAWVGYFDSITAFPTITQKHFGFRQYSDVDGTIGAVYASCGMGSGGTQVELFTPAAYSTYYVMALYQGTRVDFYYSTDGESWTKETIYSSLIPNGTYLYIGSALQNLEAISKTFQAGGYRVFQSSVVEAQ